MNNVNLSSGIYWSVAISNQLIERMKRFYELESLHGEDLSQKSWKSKVLQQKEPPKQKNLGFITPYYIIEFVDLLMLYFAA